MPKSTKLKIVWIAVVAVIAYFHLLIGTLLAIATAFYWLLDQRLRKNEPKVESKVPTQDKDEWVRLDVTSPKMHENHGWEYWDLYPHKHQIFHQHCFGGPPTHEETWVYEIRETKLFVRLVEESEEAFDGKRYTIFDGKIVKAQLEEDYKRDVQRWKDIPSMVEENFELRLAKAEQQLVFHDIHMPGPGPHQSMRGALRYFVLAKTGGYDQYINEEVHRLKKAFRDFDNAITELGGTWDEQRETYVAADDKEKAVLKFQLDENLLRFGIQSRWELKQRKYILDAHEWLMQTGGTND